MRVFFDIETSPNIVYLWQTGYKLNVNTEAIVRERTVICICWKIEGKSRVYSLTWDDNQCDRQMLAAFIDAIGEADELVAHNGIWFDMPWLRGRCVKHGLVFPDIPCLDTCAQARRQFKLNSNALDYLAQYLGVGQKIATNFSLWKRCMDGVQSAVDEMVRYCRHDVRVLEAVFGKLRPYMRATSHAGVASGQDRLSCPICGSDNTGPRGERTTAAGLVWQRMACKRKGCGKFFSLPKRTYERLAL